MMVSEAQKRLVTWGGGVNSTAVLVHLRNAGVVPEAIVFCDTGSEWPETYAYRDVVIQPWLREQGFPPVTVISRQSVCRVRLPETLREQCERIKSLPSIAFGYKKCSLKFKAEPGNTWAGKQEWARAEWAAGRRIIKVIGYDAGESRRVRPEFGDKTERKRFLPEYPLFESDIDRDGCKSLILAAGLPLPRKSACYFCPSSTDADWFDLRRDHPELWEDVVQMEQTAQQTILDPANFGLRRRGRRNQEREKNVRLWMADQVDQPAETDDVDNLMPCECGL